MFAVRVEEAGDVRAAHGGDEEEAPATADKGGAPTKPEPTHPPGAADAKDMEPSQWDEPGATPRPPPERQSLSGGAAAAASSLKGSLNSLVAATSSRTISAGHKLARTLTALATMEARVMEARGRGGGGGGGGDAPPGMQPSPSGGAREQQQAEADDGTTPYEVARDNVDLDLNLDLDLDLDHTDSSPDSHQVKHISARIERRLRIDGV